MAKNGDVTSGQVNGKGVRHAVYSEEYSWFAICGIGEVALPEEGEASKPPTCAGCKRTFRLLKMLFVEK